MTYPSDLISAIQPIPHSEDVPVPTPPTVLQEVDSESDTVETGSNESEFEPAEASTRPHLIKQAELNDLMHDLSFTKSQESCWHLDCRVGIC